MTVLKWVYMENTSTRDAFYEMWIEPAKVGSYYVVKRWGKRGTKGQTDTSKALPVLTANNMVLSIMKEKLNRGYLLRADRSFDPPSQKPEWSHGQAIFPSIGGSPAVIDSFDSPEQAPDYGEEPSEDIPEKSMFDRSGEKEAKQFTKIAEKRKEEAEW